MHTRRGCLVPKSSQPWSSISRFNSHNCDGRRARVLRILVFFFIKTLYALFFSPFIGSFLWSLVVTPFIAHVPLESNFSFLYTWTGYAVTGQNTIMCLCVFLVRCRSRLPQVRKDIGIAAVGNCYDSSNVTTLFKTVQSKIQNGKVPAFPLTIFYT